MTCITERLGKQCPAMERLTLTSVVVNVVVLLFLLPATVIVHRQLTSQSDHCHDAAPRYDDMKSSDVTQSQYVGKTGANVSRYCFKEDAAVCRERGRRVKVGEDGETVCCGHLGDHLFTVMNEALEDRVGVDTLRGRWLQTLRHYMGKLDRDLQTAILRPAAHVGILQNGNLVGPENEVPRVHWSDSGEESLLTGGILHRGDGLAVSKPGYYYVYTGLQFNVDPTTEQSGAIVAFLFRTVNGTHESRTKLMMARESSCRWTRGDGAVAPVSMHMAGIFLLRRDDVISVVTYSHALLNRAATTTYLGLHMV